MRDLEFNSNKQLVKVTDHYNSIPSSKVHYTVEHNAQGRIAVVNRFIEGQATPLETYMYEHNPDGQLTRFNVFNKLRDPSQPPQLYSFSELTYNNQKQLTLLRHYLNSVTGPALQSTTSFVYDARGNVTNTTEHRILVYQGSAATSQDIVIKGQYTYDDKPNFNKENMNLVYVPVNPFLSVLPHLSANNQITAKQETTTEGTVNGPIVYNIAPLNFNRTISYEYNEKNRAVKVIQQNGAYLTNDFVCE